jgi:hypothetical protein
MRTLLILVALTSTAFAQTDPKQQYDEQSLGFEDTIVFNAYNGMIMNRYSDPVVGRYRRPIKWNDFYTMVGRDDLASKWSTRRATKIGLGVGGGVALLASIAAIGAGVATNDAAFKSCINMGSTRCDVTTSSAGYVAGGVLMGVGFVTVLTAIILPRQPAQAWETRQMAEGYNQRLAQSLGLQ